MSGFWEPFRERLPTLILITVVAGILLVTLGPITTLVFSNVALLLLVIHHWRQLTILDKWLQTGESAFPDSSGKWGDVFARLSRLMRDQRQSHQHISSALERLRRATSAMPEGVVIMDEMDRIEWCNPVAQKHLGIDSHLDAGQHITNLVRQTQFAKYMAAQDYTEPLIIRQPRHQGLTLSLQFVPYGDKQKLLLSRDVTRFERIQTMRRDFVANVSHELRTPLTVIGGFLETLSDEDHSDPETRKWALTLMTDQTRRMQSLVEDLLMLSRLEDTENLVRDENVDVPEMLRQLYDEAQSLSAGRHRIILNIDTGAKLQGNADELRSAFSNLISNAIRYTVSGGDITLNWAIRDGEGVFSVQDTGIGIEPEHIPRLTERFYRVDRGRSRETGGTGLGLAIVKHVLTCHQARLEIDSELGKGSRFSAWFPSSRLINENDE
ncbi:phosphate regulon sensor histidine kinase PhoR [Nitrosovibrio sp. Nv6]|uniref:phosphate regulon sensor histidine kinase PhoR n=1 Tax=Nitrosovibrio sp. Nv6 TaxID=1855340 RepID=UPI0008D0805F|nr:phosphate regulon sensor histidine kinase PhoR [Nitrosovibrio sp. Nv6]SEO85979.1 two-component system, OmpR family, phosphate regulon sensor histidine kinase PhoR [Nitrosovibrio sp. Nv6]